MRRRDRSVSALLTALALLVPAMTGRLHADDAIDKKVVDIVKQTGDLYKNARSLHAEGDFVSKVASGGEKRDIKVKAVYDIERPNHLSLKTEVDGDPAKGPESSPTARISPFSARAASNTPRNPPRTNSKTLDGPCCKSDPP